MEKFQMLFPYSSTTGPSSAIYPPVSSNYMTNNSHHHQVLSHLNEDSNNNNNSYGFLGLKIENDHQHQVASSLQASQVVNKDDDLIATSNHHHHHHHQSNGSSFAIGSENEIKPTKKKGEKKIRKPRYAFQTRSQVDILDDGYRWRKYGQKAVKNNKFPRSYYRCTHQGCNVKKQVQRLTKDEGVVVTTYEGMHAHSIEKPSDNFEHILSQMQIYTPF